MIRAYLSSVLCRRQPVRRLIFFALSFAAAPIPLGAHPVPFSYLDLHLREGRLHGTLVVHAIDLAHENPPLRPEEILVPGVAESLKKSMESLLRLRLELRGEGGALGAVIEGSEVLPERQAVRFDLGFPGAEVPAVLNVRCRLFPYDPKHETFLNIYENGRLTRQEIFSGDRLEFEYYTGSLQGTLAVVRRFLRSGVHHIWAGPDHILFLLGLLLLGGGLGRLLVIVTAFTAAHSITLSLAALNLASPPSRIIEPAIALSIIYVGIDNLMVGKQGRDVRAWIAFFFGFVHGFGFANVVREIGLPAQALGWSLFSFNLGVEVGQACIVVLVASLLAGVRRRDRLWSQRIATVGSMGIIVAGTYWFLQRIFFST